ncbi:MAG: aminotransferase class III-fold pyridoxal phosphate-dependent enzyme, partial [Burkholderiaceae bacterium]
ARAATGKDNVAICGYHGWHDWYLAVNHESSDSLKEHLLPGLNPSGVPKALSGTVYPFSYNNFDYLEKLVEENDIGTIKMEVERNEKPKNDFLKKVRQLADKNGIVLIFDECTSGFRETFGGLHQKYYVNPDIAMYGKALGNGYALTAVVGKSEVMQACQSTFISSTFWTERIGPAAALKTLEVMEKKKSWDEISNVGSKVSTSWKELAMKHELSLDIKGIKPLPSFSFKSNNALKYKTFLTQEMLKKGFLANTSFYACTEHNDDVLEAYFEGLDDIFLEIKKCELGQDIDKLLEGPVCHDGFARLN